MVDENNRECCICLDENKLGDRVVRLPCAHIYHPKCISDWLLRHCTCPVCRYELPTDDPSYETLRIERMKRRKPRFALYELERMPAKELRSLARNRLGLRGALTDGAVERSDLVRAIVDSGKIELISAPEPVEYGAVGELRAMGVGKLRRAMEEAGVFFDPIDVVEKEDMVQIFVKSGRVVFREEEETEKEEEEEEDLDLDSEADVGKEQNGSGGEFERKRSFSERDEGNRGDGATSSGRASPSLSPEPGESEVDAPTGVAEGGGNDDGEGANSLASAAATVTTTAGAGAAQQQQQPALASRSVTQLKALGRELGVDLSTCIEKREMVEKLADAAMSSASGRAHG